MNTAHLLHTYGYWAVLLFVGAESLGIPLPGETILISAGIYAGSTHKLSVWGIYAAAVAGAVIGDNVGFLVGDKGGYRLLRRYGHFVRIDEAKIKVGRYIFDRHGAKVVFLGRFVSVLRTYAAFLAGTLKMHWRVFLPFNALGGLVWAAIYTFVPYEVGTSVNGADKTFKYVLGAVAAVAIVAAIVAVRRKAASLEERAEEAYPGPLPER